MRLIATLLFLLVPILGVWTFVDAPAHGWWMPATVTTFGPSIDRLFYLILWMVTFFFLLTEGVLVYAFFKYSKKRGDKCEYTHGNHKLELLWTGIPAALLLVIAFSQMGTWAEIKFRGDMPEEEPLAHVWASQFDWRFQYAGPDGQFGTMDDFENPFEFVVPEHFFPGEHLPEFEPVADVDLSRYAGEYVPLRRNHSSIEKLGKLVNFIDVQAGDSGLVVRMGETVRHWLPLGDGRFRELHSGRPVVFQQNADGGTSNLMIAAPTVSFERVRGIDAPGNIRLLLLAAMIVSLTTVIGYGYRGVRRVAPGSGLPTGDVAAAWVFALVSVLQSLHMAAVLGGNTYALLFGFSAPTQINLVVGNLNLLLAMGVILLSVRQWVRSSGDLMMRMRYSAVALAAVMSIWFAVHFNIASYLFA